MIHSRFRSLHRLAAGAALAAGLTACAVEKSEFVYNEENVDTDFQNRNTIFGAGGLNLFNDDGPRVQGGVAVNSFLWRAALDTISFMPISTADPFGGVITTDWHSAAPALNERFKVNVFILTPTLRADGLRVSVFSQRKQPAGWTDAALPNGTAVKIEDAILTRARQLRRQSLEE